MISQFFVFASRAELRFCQFFQKLSAVSLSEIYFDNYKDESFFNTYPESRRPGLLPAFWVFFFMIWALLLHLAFRNPKTIWNFGGSDSSKCRLLPSRLRLVIKVGIQFTSGAAGT